MSPPDVPRWASALSRLLRADHRDDIVADLLDEGASLVARGRSRAYVSLWLAAHLVRSALVSWPAVAESIGRDARYGIRMLRRSPGFSLVAAAVLALGIGANTAIFSLVNALFFRPLPVRAPTELAFIYPAKSNQGLSCTFDEYLAYKADTSLFTDAAAMNGDVAMFGSAADGTWVSGESVTSNYFELLGVRPRVGRSFTAGDDAPDAAPAIIISDRVWRRRFLADPAILGQAIRLRQPQNTDSGWRYTVVGIMGPEFNGIQSPWTPTEFWTPMLQRNREYDAVYRSILPSFRRSVGLVIGRRQRGVSLQQLQQVVTTRHKAFDTTQSSGPARRADSIERSLVVLDSRRFSLPLDDQGRIAPSRLAGAIAAVSGLVLLIAVTNLIGITIARGVVRRSEIAVRLTLGATRQRLARQLVTEGLLLSTAGGLIGLVWSEALVSMFLATLPSTAGSPLGIAFDVPIDLQVLLFTVLVVVGVGIAIGLAPVRQGSKTDLVSALANASEPAPRRTRSRLRYWIVIPQICVCTTLLLAAGVSTKALLKIALVDPGYRPEGVVTTAISLPIMRSTLPSESAELRRTRNDAFGARLAELQRRILEEVTALPGTVAAAFTSTTPLGGMPFAAVARDEASGHGPEASLNTASVTPGYFAAIGLPLRAGRTFDARDAAAFPRVAIVDEATANRGEPPVAGPAGGGPVARGSQP
jgi:putative ABC transport system permease protein